jgi:hypothetical protein
MGCRLLSEGYHCGGLGYNGYTLAGLTPKTRPAAKSKDGAENRAGLKGPPLRNQDHKGYCEQLLSAVFVVIRN